MHNVFFPKLYCNNVLGEFSCIEIISRLPFQIWVDVCVSKMCIVCFKIYADPCGRGLNYVIVQPWNRRNDGEIAPQSVHFPCRFLSLYVR